MSSIILVLKGFIVGIGKIIPGVSGAMLAISMGLYEESIYSIRYFFKDIKRNTLFLSKIGLGVLIAIVIGSKIIKFLLFTIYIPTMILFLGLITGGFFSFIKEINMKNINYRNKIIFLICFLSVLLFKFIPSDSGILLIEQGRNIVYFIIGLIDSATTIIPGISGTAIFMLLGLYELSIELFSSLDSLSNIIKYSPILIPYVIGLGLGGITMTFLMTYLFVNKKEETYFGILGFQLSAIIILLTDIISKDLTNKHFVISPFIFLLGFIAIKKLNKK